MTKISKALEHKRGKDFSCIVVYNAYSDHISFHEIEMPSTVSLEVKEAFLAEAELAMLNKIDSDWDTDMEMVNARGWGME